MGWIAKPVPRAVGRERDDSGTMREGATGTAAYPSDSRAAPDGRSGGPTIISSGRSRESFIGSGQGAGLQSGDRVTVQGSVPVTAPSNDTANALGGVSGGQGGPLERVTQDTHNQPPVLGGDPSASDNSEQQDPVVSIPFDNTTLPDKGEAPIAEQGIAFDGHGATFATDSQLAIPDAANLTGDAGTVTFCLRPQWSGNEPTDASLVNLRTPNVFENRLQIAKNGQNLRLLMADNTGHEAGAALNISGWQPGENHLVTATWGQALTSLYVDGQLVDSGTYQGELQIAPGTPMYIGSDVPGGIAGAQGSLSNFQVYNRALTPEDVAGLTGNCQ